jgi:hypothetical protein
VKGNRKEVSISNEQQYRFEVNMQRTVTSATVKWLDREVSHQASAMSTVPKTAEEMD